MSVFEASKKVRICWRARKIWSDLFNPRRDQDQLKGEIRYRPRRACLPGRARTPGEMGGEGVDLPEDEKGYTDLYKWYVDLYIEIL